MFKQVSFIPVMKKRGNQGKQASDMNTDENDKANKDQRKSYSRRTPGRVA